MSFIRLEKRNNTMPDSTTSPTYDRSARHLKALKLVIQARLELLRGDREVPDYHKETDKLLATAVKRLSRIGP